MAGRATHRLGATAVAAALLCGACGQGHQETVPTCSADEVVLTTDQAANAATIAAVGKRLGVPNHGVTVAFATAFQESGLRNLDYGDRDSLGLFQQRPSQGWGTPADITTPHLSAAKFFRALVKVEGWQTMDVTVAAQRVQRSAAPDAYAQWEDPGRTLARALTGEVEAGLACEFDVPETPAPIRRLALQRQAVRELGPGGLQRADQPGRRWATATWLVAQARAYGIVRVSIGGQTWTAASGTWEPDSAATELRYS
jgi:hypothetical protein